MAGCDLMDHFISFPFFLIKNILWVFKKYFILFFLERRKEGESEGEKHQCVVTSLMPQNGDLACNPGMSPDWELNL